MLSIVVLVLMVGIIAGAVGREIGGTFRLGDSAPWILGILGAAIGAAVGLALAGWDTTEDGDQWAALVGCLLGGALGAAAYLALPAKAQHDVETNDRTRIARPAHAADRDPLQ